jgi:phosphonate transport system substrate-binding protein
LKRLVVALKPDKDPQQIYEERGKLSEFMSERLGKPVDVIVPLSASIILEGLASGTVDLAFVSATDMLNARQKESAEILLAGEINGRTHYQSYWLALKEKPYQSIGDLKGKPVAFASRTSTSGYLVPHWALVKKGYLREGAPPEEFFGERNVWYGSGYVSAVEQVLNGTAEAAAVSYYVLDEDRHLRPEQRALLKKIDEQGPVPTHVIAVRSGVSAEEKARLKEMLQSMDAPEHRELRDRLFTSKLVEVNGEEHLGSLDEAMKLTGRSR